MVKPTSGGEIFKYFVCRVAGLPVSSMENLRLVQTVDAQHDVFDLEKRLSVEGSALADRLYAIVGELKDRRVRGSLLQVRRDVHNVRRPKLAAQKRVESKLPPAIAIDLQRYCDQYDELIKRRSSVEEIFEGEILASRKKLRGLVDDTDFQKGLCLSSEALLRAARRYQAGRHGTKNKQIERGLMRYLSRMAMKTSPFGTFCAIAAGELSTDPSVVESQELMFTGDPRRKQSLVRLNKGIYEALVPDLLRSPAIRRQLGVELNPTLRREGEQWLFLSVVSRREVFQRVPRSPVLDLFKEVLASHSHLSLGELRGKVRKSPRLDASRAQIEAFTDRLLEIGFLRLRLGIPEQEVDWDRPLVSLLGTIEDPEAIRIRQLITGLRKGCDAFAMAPVVRRGELLQEAAELMRKSDEDLLRRATFQVNIPFYEDAGVAASIAMSKCHYEQLTESLTSFVRLTAPIAWPRHERASMRHFFDTYYPTDTTEVPLLQFYEDYYREHLKEHLHRQQVPPPIRQEVETADTDIGSSSEVAAASDAEPGISAENFDALNPFGLDLIRQMKVANGALTRLIQERWQADPDALTIDFDRHDLAAIVEPVPPTRDPCRSVSVFVQALPGAGRDGGPGFVTSTFLNGFGKYFSRFLDLLPEQVQQDLFDNNLDLSDEYLAEICGDGAFNGNLHPPLLRWEVSYPTGESGSAEGQLLSSELVVEVDAGDNYALCLRHLSSGQRVVPLDLGFQNPRMRPPLYQLLSGFGPACNYSLSVPDQPYTAGVETVAGAALDTLAESTPQPGEASIQYRPRVTYEGGLVLARRRWRVRGEAFPRRQSGEQDFAYFQRADGWRREHGLPMEMFLTVKSLPPPAANRQQSLIEETVSKQNSRPRTPGTSRSDDSRSGNNPPRPAPERGGSDVEPASTTKGPVPPRRGHLHKPQYIDFANPFLVDVFGRSAENLEHFEVRLYERLPDREHLARSGDECYVTEMVLQLDFRGPKAGRAQRRERGRHAA